MAAEEISGNVTDGGSAVDGAKVIAIHTDGTPTVQGTDTTNVNGDYTISNLPHGEYHIAAQWDDGTDLHNAESKSFVSVPASISSATTGVTVQTPAPSVTAFLPSNISSLKHWYDPRDISGSDGDAIGTLSDKEGSADLTTSNSSEKPLLKTNEIGGNQVLKFDGSDDMLYDDWADVTPPLYVFMVVSFHTTPSTSANQYIFSSDGSSNRLDLSNRGNEDNTWKVLTHSNTLESGVTVDTSDHIIGYSSLDASGGSEIRIDGTQEGTANVTDDLIEASLAEYDNDDRYNAPIQTGEILIYDGDLTSSEISDVESYLSREWGVTI